MTYATDEQVEELRKALLAVESVGAITGREYTNRKLAEMSGTTEKRMASIRNGKTKAIPATDYATLLRVCDVICAEVTA